MRRFSYLFLILSVFIFSACGSVPDSTISSNSGTTNNTITIQGSDTVELNTTSQYTAVLSPANFTTDAINWTIDNNSVGTIDNNGFFTAKNIGTVNIKASAGGVESALFSIKVVTPSAVPVESVIVSPLSKKEVNAGVPEQFYYELMPSNAEYTSVTWSVDNTEIANINKDTGILTGSTAGTVNVSVTVDDVTSQPYPVNVIVPVDSISITGASSVDTLTQTTYTVTNTSVTGVEWSVDNKTLAVIDASTGVFTARNTAGQVTITATANGKTATKLVTIKKDLKISGNNTTAIGGKITLKVLNNTTNSLTWNSDNKGVATVNNGVVTGVGAGTANITVSENGKSATIAVTVKNMPQNGYELIDGAYHVYNLAGFKAWVEGINTGTLSNSTNFYLYSDLDFTSESDILITKSYNGIFNGNGHILKNYTITNGRGFVKSVGSKGQVINVTFDSANVTYTFDPDTWNTSAGIITSSNNGLIENVHVKNSALTLISNNGQNDVGIISAEAFDSETKNCSVTNSTITVTGTMNNTGGIIGLSRQGSIVSGCFVDNLIISTQGTTNNIGGIGGIVGQQQERVGDTVAGCGVVNTSITNTVKGHVGGIIGTGGDNLYSSYFYGAVENAKSSVGLDFSSFNGTASTLFVKQKGGPVGTINGQDSTTLVDGTTVTWEQAVESMNQYLIDNGYIDFAYKYDANKGYPVIEYSK